MTYTPEVWGEIIANGIEEAGGGGGTGGGYDAVFKTNGIDIASATNVELVSGDYEAAKAKLEAGEMISVGVYSYVTVDDNTYNLTYDVATITYNTYDIGDEIEIVVIYWDKSKTGFVAGTSGGSPTNKTNIPVTMRVITWASDGCTIA